MKKKQREAAEFKKKKTTFAKKTAHNVLCLPNYA